MRDVKYSEAGFAQHVLQRTFTDISDFANNTTYNDNSLFLTNDATDNNKSTV